MDNSQSADVQEPPPLSHSREILLDYHGMFVALQLESSIIEKALETADLQHTDTDLEEKCGPLMKQIEESPIFMKWLESPKPCFLVINHPELCQEEAKIQYAYIANQWIDSWKKTNPVLQYLWDSVQPSPQGSFWVLGNLIRELLRYDPPRITHARWPIRPSGCYDKVHLQELFTQYLFQLAGTKKTICVILQGLHDEEQPGETASLVKFLMELIPAEQLWSGCIKMLIMPPIPRDVLQLVPQDKILNMGVEEGNELPPGKRGRWSKYLRR
ncbi:hypothetical protein K491DRAFT_685840 [Lophiostoma macrostomum CBS 122681]|uniref:Uncharacterized protein n=1 Tax=Lophiostoma macrostomum CBS 122681 TaxID=1314788 RepID=A0A6A6SLI6_9PLEO|nr:hypothetical protein K491DRAFT_685840 [Lophiostoma macrostomum CBS 122681]